MLIYCVHTNANVRAVHPSVRGEQSLNYIRSVPIGTWRNEMGNYHQYSLKSYAEDVFIPEEHFCDENAVNCLFHYDYVERKRWEFAKDLIKVSKANPNILITIVETDEDETIMRQHQFFDGEHKSVDGKIVFPEINWFN